MDQEISSEIPYNGTCNYKAVICQLMLLPYSLRVVLKNKEKKFKTKTKAIETDQSKCAQYHIEPIRARKKIGNYRQARETCNWFEPREKSGTQFALHVCASGFCIGIS